MSKPALPGALPTEGTSFHGIPVTAGYWTIELLAKPGDDQCPRATRILVPALWKRPVAPCHASVLRVDGPLLSGLGVLSLPEVVNLKEVGAGA
jgi:hypothetical protein